MSSTGLGDSKMLKNFWICHEINLAALYDLLLVCLQLISKTFILTTEVPCGGVVTLR